MLNVNKKLTYLKKHHGFQDGELSEISKFYHGEPFDETEAGFLRLKALSENLCKSYSLFDKSLPNPTSLLSIAHHYLKRRHLLKAIFLGCHFSADIRPDFRCLIGQVDLVGTCFINQGIRVAPHALVRLENNAILGPNVVLGDEGYGKIVVKNNCWVGAGVRIASNLTLGEGSVIGAGAALRQNVAPFNLALGRPAKEIALQYHKKEKPGAFTFSPEEIAKLKAHLQRLGLASATKDYLKVLVGGYTNVGNLALGRLFVLSHALSYEYSSPRCSQKRREEILDLLFPLGHEGFESGTTLFLDLLGSVRLGKNVCFGEGVSCYGCISVGDEVNVGTGALLIASGHPLESKLRRFRYRPFSGFRSLSDFVALAIDQKIAIGDNAVLTPGSHAKNNIPENAILTPHGKIIL